MQFVVTQHFRTHHSLLFNTASCVCCGKDSCASHTIVHLFAHLSGTGDGDSSMVVGYGTRCTTVQLPVVWPRGKQIDNSFIISPLENYTSLSMYRIRHYKNYRRPLIIQSLTTREDLSHLGTTLQAAPFCLNMIKEDKKVPHFEFWVGLFYSVRLQN